MEDHDYGRMLVLGHYTQVQLAGIEQMLVERGVRRPFEVIDATAGVPETLGEDVRGILVMGGLMGVPEIDQLPWMQQEVELLRTAHAREVPVLGICLGAQLLAHALGGTVERRPTPEVGLFSLHRTAEAKDDQVFAGFPDGGRVALTHNDEVTELPPGAVPMLAGDQASGTPAWKVGDTIHAVQFHPEIAPGLLQFWIDEGFGTSIEAAGVDAEAFTAEVTAEARFLRAVGLALVGRWIDGVVGKGDPSPRKHRKDAA